MEKYEQIAFQIISNVGMAKSTFMEAISKSKEGNYTDADNLLKEGNQYLIDGHKVHKELIQEEAKGESIPMNLLLVHAEDQLMSSEIIKEMAKELIYIHKHYKNN